MSPTMIALLTNRVCLGWCTNNVKSMIHGGIATDDRNGRASESGDNGNDGKEERFSSQRAAAKS